jgi:hypothetical protein
MSRPCDIVRRYFDAFYAGDSATARQYLADDFSFVGPEARFSSADNFIKASAHVSRAVKSVERQKVFVDGSDVCILFELVLEQFNGGVAVADLYHLEDGKISSIRTILDTAPFKQRARTDPDQTAIDPVCRMSVSKNAYVETGQLG